MKNFESMSDFELLKELCRVQQIKIEEERDKNECLERIASVLEDINSTLISMSVPIEQLSECVGYAPPRHYQKQGYNFLRIAGQVDTK